MIGASSYGGRTLALQDAQSTSSLCWMAFRTLTVRRCRGRTSRGVPQVSTLAAWLDRHSVQAMNKKKSPELLPKPRSACCREGDGLGSHSRGFLQSKGNNFLRAESSGVLNGRAMVHGKARCAMRRRDGGGCGSTYGGVAQENAPCSVLLLLFQSEHRSSRDNVAVCVVLETVLAFHNATRKVLTSEVNVGPQHIFPRRFAFTALAPSSGDASVVRRVQAIRASRPSFRVRSSASSSVESSSTSSTSASISSHVW